MVELAKVIAQISESAEIDKKRRNLEERIKKAGKDMRVKTGTEMEEKWYDEECKKVEKKRQLRKKKNDNPMEINKREHEDHFILY